MVTPDGAAPGPHLDRTAGRGVAHRVLEQVRHDLVHPLGVAVGREAGLVDVHLDDDAGCMELLLAYRVREHRRDREVLAVEGHGAGLEPGEVQELGDQAAEPLDLGEHREERVRVGGGDAVDDVLERRLERGEWGAQLVADVRDEVPAHPVGLTELRGHPVERTGEAADLVARGVGDPRE